MMKIGVFEAEVVAINPSRDCLSSLLGRRVKTEPVYVGDAGVKVVAALKDKYSSFIAFAVFSLSYYPVISSRGKYNYINEQTGRCCWAEGEDNIPSYMWGDGCSFRTMVEGEQELVDFVRLVGSYDSYDYKRILEGKTDCIIPRKTIGAVATVATPINSPEKQTVCTKKFIPAQEVDYFRKDYSTEYIKELMEKDPRDLAEWQKLLVSLNNRYYPCPDLFVNGYLRDYDPSLNLISLNKTIIKES